MQSKQTNKKLIKTKLSRNVLTIWQHFPNIKEKIQTKQKQNYTEKTTMKQFI